MLNRKKQPNEDMLKHFYEKLAMINSAEIKGEKAVQLLISGLDNLSMQNSAKAGKFNTPEELLGYLKTVTQVNRSVNRSDNYTRFCHQQAKSTSATKYAS